MKFFGALHGSFNCSEGGCDGEGNVSVRNANGSAGRGNVLMSISELAGDGR